MERLTRLLLESNIFIALPGSVGTIGELALVWNHISIDFRVNQASKMHLVLWRQPFQRFVEDSVKSLGLATMDTNNIHFVDDPQEALTLVKTLTGA
jgi:predicted Rossmann-fold nucleotide-binding protein